MTTSYTDHFLIAFPTLLDPNFFQSVIYVYEHTEEGAMGLIINKPLKMQVGEIFEHLNIEIKNKSIASRAVMMGGPLGQEHGFVLYRSLKQLAEEDEMEGENEEDSDGNVFLSSSKETLVAIANGKGPDDFIITLGYAGWEGGQLEDEIQHNDWLVAPFDNKIVFDVPIEKRWREAAALIGVDIDRLSGQTGHA